MSYICWFKIKLTTRITRLKRNYCTGIVKSLFIFNKLLYGYYRYGYSVIAMKKDLISYNDISLSITYLF